MALYCFYIFYASTIPNHFEKSFPYCPQASTKLVYSPDSWWLSDPFGHHLTPLINCYNTSNVYHRPVLSLVFHCPSTFPSKLYTCAAVVTHWLHCGWELNYGNVAIHQEQGHNYPSCHYEYWPLRSPCRHKISSSCCLLPVFLLPTGHPYNGVLSCTQESKKYRHGLYNRGLSV